MTVTKILEAISRRQSEERRTLIFAIVAAVALAIGLLVLLYYRNQSRALRARLRQREFDVEQERRNKEFAKTSDERIRIESQVQILQGQVDNYKGTIAWRQKERKGMVKALANVTSWEEIDIVEGAPSTPFSSQSPLPPDASV